jgi:DNA processing protein
MPDDALAACLVLQATTPLPTRELTAFLESFPDPVACLNADSKRWREAGLGAAAADALARQRDAWQARRDTTLLGAHERLQRLGVEALTVCDAHYPPLLRAIDSPPPLLYLRGRIESLSARQVAIVGSRRASPLGEKAAAEIAAQLAALGLGVVSGLARGIDAAAHRGALAGGGMTLAVMATGIDRIYPAVHRDLAGDIAASGCLLSEFPPLTEPLRHNFPRRNRIISGLAEATVVVEAALPSGSLITANTALQQGREVFALPWSIFHHNGRGCLQLLRDGAALVQEARDIAEVLGLSLATPIPTGPDEAPVSATAQRVLGALEATPLDVDSLVASLDLAPAAVFGALTELELAARIVRREGGYVRAS